MLVVIQISDTKNLCGAYFSFLMTSWKQSCVLEDFRIG